MCERCKRAGYTAADLPTGTYRKRNHEGIPVSYTHLLVVGAGGLGSPVSLYLAAAGVGTIGIADFDRVDVSNLQRQILYREQDIGLSLIHIW